jgi:uncharacterized membrane protein
MIASCAGADGAAWTCHHRGCMTDGLAFHPLDPRGARARLIYAVGLGVLTWFLFPGMARSTRALLAGDAASFVLAAVAIYIIGFTDPAETRRRAAAYDPGRRLVWILVILTSMFGLLASVIVIRQGKTSASFEGQLHIVLCVATVMFSWILTHSAFTLRYAHLYYRGEGNGGISFPGDEPPDDLDFAYFAFTIGMTFQVSDNNISSREVRRTVLRHALLSFVYNTVIVALALNLVVGQFS